MKHLLVTNDFPPKVGGIQSYLWELWKRLDHADVTVLTTPYEGDADWDAQQDYRVVRTKQKWLLPTPGLVRQINALAREVKAEMVVLDPVFPLGMLGPKLELPYIAVAHGAEYVIPARIPFTRTFIRTVTAKSAGVIACGQYVAGFAQKMSSATPNVSIPPGVDTVRFAPLSADQRKQARAKFAIADDAKVVVGVSRLVPRKGFDRLIKASVLVGRREPLLQVLIAGSGRDAGRLRRLVERSKAPVTMLGRVPDADLPALYGAADLFCMPCHDRWLGLEQEGFGIVFVEAGAAGLASVAGLSGGSGEAVLDGQTGLVVGGSVSVRGLADALAQVVGDERRRSEMSIAARRRAAEVFSYDHLADELRRFLEVIAIRSDHLNEES